MLGQELSEAAVQYYISAVDYLKEEKEFASNQKSLIAEIAGEIAGLETDNHDKIREIINGAKKNSINTFIDYLSYDILFFCEKKKNRWRCKIIIFNQFPFDLIFFFFLNSRQYKYTTLSISELKKVLEEGTTKGIEVFDTNVVKKYFYPSILLTFSYFSNMSIGSIY